MSSGAFELTIGNERLRLESIYQPRASAYLEKKVGNHSIRRRIDRTHSSECDEGFTVIGESRGS